MKFDRVKAVLIYLAIGCGIILTATSISIFLDEPGMPSSRMSEAMP